MRKRPGVGSLRFKDASTQQLRAACCMPADVCLTCDSFLASSLNSEPKCEAREDGGKSRSTACSNVADCRSKCCADDQEDKRKCTEFVRTPGCQLGYEPRTGLGTKTCADDDDCNTECCRRPIIPAKRLCASYTCEPGTKSKALMLAVPCLTDALCQTLCCKDEDPTKTRKCKDFLSILGGGKCLPGMVADKVKSTHECSATHDAQCAEYCCKKKPVVVDEEGCVAWFKDNKCKAGTEPVKGAFTLPVSKLRCRGAACQSVCCTDVKLDPILCSKHLQHNKCPIGMVPKTGKMAMWEKCYSPADCNTRCCDELVDEKIKCTKFVKTVGCKFGTSPRPALATMDFECSSNDGCQVKCCKEKNPVKFDCLKYYGKPGCHTGTERKIKSDAVATATKCNGFDECNFKCCKPEVRTDKTRCAAYHSAPGCAALTVPKPHSERFVCTSTAHCQSNCCIPDNPVRQVLCAAFQREGKCEAAGLVADVGSSSTKCKSTAQCLEDCCDERQVKSLTCADAVCAKPMLLNPKVDPSTPCSSPADCASTKCCHKPTGKVETCGTHSCEANTQRKDGVTDATKCEHGACQQTCCEDMGDVTQLTCADAVCVKPMVLDPKVDPKTPCDSPADCASTKCCHKPTGKVEKCAVFSCSTGTEKKDNVDGVECEGAACQTTCCHKPEDIKQLTCADAVCVKPMVLNPEVDPTTECASPEDCASSKCCHKPTGKVETCAAFACAADTVKKDGVNATECEGTACQSTCCHKPEDIKQLTCADAVCVKPMVLNPEVDPTTECDSPEDCASSKCCHKPTNVLSTCATFSCSDGTIKRDGVNATECDGAACQSTCCKPTGGDTTLTLNCSMFLRTQLCQPGTEPRAAALSMTCSGVGCQPICCRKKTVVVTGHTCLTHVQRSGCPAGTHPIKGRVTMPCASPVLCATQCCAPVTIVQPHKCITFTSKGLCPAGWLPNAAMAAVPCANPALCATQCCFKPTIVVQPQKCAAFTAKGLCGASLVPNPATATLSCANPAVCATQCCMKRTTVIVHPQKCAAFTGKGLCGAGLIPNPATATTPCASPAVCATQCCMKPPVVVTHQKCAALTANGLCAGVGMVPNPAKATQPCTDAAKCAVQCCMKPTVVVEPMTCAKYVALPAGCGASGALMKPGVASVPCQGAECLAKCCMPPPTCATFLTQQKCPMRPKLNVGAVPCVGAACFQTCCQPVQGKYTCSMFLSGRRCPVGSKRKFGTESLACVGAQCEQQCCQPVPGKVHTCTHYFASHGHCLPGSQRNPLTSSAPCLGQACLQTCCQKPATCSKFFAQGKACPANAKRRFGVENTPCVEDQCISACCDIKPPVITTGKTCRSFKCPLGMLAKPHGDAIACPASGGCQPQQCCMPAGSMTDESSSGMPSHSSSFVNSESSGDHVLPPMVCASFVASTGCPSGQTTKPGSAAVQCRGQSACAAACCMPQHESASASAAEESASAAEESASVAEESASAAEESASAAEESAEVSTEESASAAEASAAPVEESASGAREASGSAATQESSGSESVEQSPTVEASAQTAKRTAKPTCADYLRHNSCPYGTAAHPKSMKLPCDGLFCIATCCSAKAASAAASAPVSAADSKETYTCELFFDVDGEKCPASAERIKEADGEECDKEFDCESTCCVSRKVKRKCAEAKDSSCKEADHVNELLDRKQEADIDWTPREDGRKSCQEVVDPSGKTIVVCTHH
eukprot:TRINITY_DN63233_c0_g2_i2.p1 TRINITY_DN63233_c0_g2~~TRINITY_DN63233_c0_g2_i2.p1  ORF type:complete len:1919 (+),score=707.91 TRINITY_DN63233_c0_g2_i2:608-5758(+)